MPMTPGERILVNWMTETGNGMVRHGGELSAAIDDALYAKDAEIAELKEALASKTSTMTFDDMDQILSKLGPL